MKANYLVFWLIVLSCGVEASFINVSIYTSLMDDFCPQPEIMMCPDLACISSFWANDDNTYMINLTIRRSNSTQNVTQAAVLNISSSNVSDAAGDPWITGATMVLGQNWSNFCGPTDNNFYCVLEAFNMNTSTAQRTWLQMNYSSNCNYSTTTTTTTISIRGTLPGASYIPVWGISDGGDVNGSSGQGLGNRSGLGSTILGLSTTNFFSLLALLIITMVMLAVSAISVKSGVLMSIVTTDLFVVVDGFKWLDVPMSLLLLINFMAVLLFVTRGVR